MKLYYLALSLILCATASIARRTAKLAPLYTPQAARLLEDSYIVILKSDVPEKRFNAHMNALEIANFAKPVQGANSGLEHVFNNDIVKGYSGKFSEDVVEMIRRRPEVDYVERDQIMRVAKTQERVPWGLARISHREPLEREKAFQYEYVENGGEGVMVYVIDSGIYVEHEEFEGRARWGSTVIKGEPDVDESGHGTHVAGIIASRRFGVAKAANLTAVKVVDAEGQGNMGTFVQGALWAAFDIRRLSQEAAAGEGKNGSTKYKGAVINMSLSGAHSQVSEQVLNQIVDIGIPIVVAAGNDVSDACLRSPGSTEKVITVGASTIDDRRMCDTNHGECVDVFAPGQDILSTWTDSPRSMAEASGTSMASPHVAGLLAYLISIYPHKTFDPEFGNVPLPPSLATKNSPAYLLDAYEVAYDALPSYLACMLPPPSVFSHKLEMPEVTSAKPLTPEELKKALLLLSTEGKLAPESLFGSPNRLVFNNATDAGGNSWIDDDFWVRFKQGA